MKVYVIYRAYSEDEFVKIFIDKKEAEKYAEKTECEIKEYNISEKCEKYIVLDIGMFDVMREGKLWDSHRVNASTEMSNRGDEEGVECVATKKGMFFHIKLNLPSESWTCVEAQNKSRKIADEVKAFAKDCLDKGMTVDEINTAFKTWNLEKFKVNE